MSSKIDILGLDFLEDFPICQYWTKHFGIALGIYILSTPSFRQNKINVWTSQDFSLLVPKWSVFISGLQQIPDPVITQFSLQFHLDLQIYITIQLHVVWKSDYKLLLRCGSMSLFSNTEFAWSCIL